MHLEYRQTSKYGYNFNDRFHYGIKEARYSEKKLNMVSSASGGLIVFVLNNII